LSNNVLECIAEPVFDSTLSPSIIASTSSLLLRSPVAKLLAASIMLLCVPPCRRMYSAAAASVPLPSSPSPAGITSPFRPAPPPLSESWYFESIEEM